MDHPGQWWHLNSPKSNFNFNSRAELALKNKFNSYLRKAIKILANHDKKVLKKLNKGIEKIIGVMLEFSHQVQKLIQNLKLTVNKNSLLFTFRS